MNRQTVIKRYPLKKRVVVPVLAVLVLGIAIILSACTSTPVYSTSTQGSGATSTPASTQGSSTNSPPAIPSESNAPSTPASSSGSTSTPTAPTYQTLADAGQSTYSSSCSRCHGSGERTSLWGSGTPLGVYSGDVLFTDAQEMLNFISARMPQSAPGSLSKQQYQELLAFILLKNSLVLPSAVFDANNLSSISIP